MTETPQAAAVASDQSDGSLAGAQATIVRRKTLSLSIDVKAKREREAAEAEAVRDREWLDAFENPIIDEGQTPPRIEPNLKKAPKIREMYWCELPRDAVLPELWKTRSVIVISIGTIPLYGTVVVIPTTSSNDKNDPNLHPISKSLKADCDSYAICDKPMTVSVSRLRRNGIPPRLDEEEFDEIIRKMHVIIPAPKPLPAPAGGGGA